MNIELQGFLHVSAFVTTKAGNCFDLRVGKTVSLGALELFVSKNSLSHSVNTYEGTLALQFLLLLVVIKLFLHPSRLVSN